MGPRSRPSTRRPQPRILKGLGVSPGVVIGRIAVLNDDIHRVAPRPIRPEEVRAEVARFDNAVKESVEELGRVHRQAEREMGKDAAKIFLFHVGMLSDKSLLGPIRKMIESERVGAEFAVSQVMGALADKFRGAPDSVFATKVNDIDDLSARLLRQLVGRRETRLASVAENTILVARDVTPSQTMTMDRTRVLGLATDLGGRTGHTSIVARALGMPAVVGFQNLTAVANDGAPAILDGDRGQIILDPTDEQLEEFRGYIEQRRVFQLSLEELAQGEARTRDGTRIDLMGNIEFPDEIERLTQVGGDGVGLYRTEFLWLTGKHQPTERDHFNAYKRCLELLKGRPLVIRTYDLGADKVAVRAPAHESNPFLGCRGIRYCLRDLPLFKRQLRAILRASALAPGTMKVMFPMVMSPAEFRHGKYLLNDVMEDLAEEGTAFDRGIKVGMMVEVPSAALMAESFAREVDFFSIGSNDLVQYTLAVDRTNEQIANLYNPAHPAVLRLLKEVVRVGDRHGLPVSCCGEAAAELDYAMLLIGLGVRTLSVTGPAIPQLKRMVRSVSVSACERMAQQAMALDSDVQVSAFLRDQARKVVPEAFDGRAAE